jgi:hypothetical protein
MDEPNVRCLLDQMAQAEPPSSRVDVRLASRLGRRRLRWRRICASGASGLAAIALAGLLSSDLITSGPTGAVAAGTAKAQAGFSPFVPYASFGWLPVGFTADTTKVSPPVQTAQSTLVTAASMLTDQAFLLVVYPAGSCQMGPWGKFVSPMITQNFERRHHHAPPPYFQSCRAFNFSTGEGVGPVNGQVNGVDTYLGSGQVHGDLGNGGNYLTWEYAKGAWAQLQLTTTSSRDQGQDSGAWISGSAATAALLRVADRIRFGEGQPESFPFQITGMPTNQGLYSTSYAAYGARTLNTNLWLGLGPSAPENDIEISATPANKPATCAFVKGRSTRGTLDGARFTLTTMPVPDSYGAAVMEGWQQEELCGYTDHLQISILVAQNLLSRQRWPLTSAELSQYTAVTVLDHMMLLGPDPANWTTNPLG